MDVRQILRKSDTLVGFVRDIRKLSRKPATASPDTRGELLKSYLASHEIRKLQIGSGSIALPGWLNTDAWPRCEGGVCLDVRKSFPFEERTFDYVFSEHMIYQFDWHQGISILKECCRVLKPGGTLRVAVADLEVLIGLYTRGDDPLDQRFIAWEAERFPERVCKPMAAFVINNHFRAWSTEFLYDGELMELALQEAGFTHVVRRAVGESDEESLRGIESHGKAMHAEEMVAYETMVYEAQRPL